MTTPATPCPVCRSTRCLAGTEYVPGKKYAHRWIDSPMAATYLKYRDEHTPPAGPEDLPGVVALIPDTASKPETLSLQKPETLSDETLSSAPDETLSDATCAECSKPFTPARATARFCSASCRLKAHRRAEAPA